MGKQANPGAGCARLFVGVEEVVVDQVANGLGAHIDCHGVEAILADEVPWNGERLVKAWNRDAGISLAGKGLDDQSTMGNGRLGPRALIDLNRPLVGSCQRIIIQQKVGARARQVRDHSILGRPVRSWPVCGGVEGEAGGRVVPVGQVGLLEHLFCALSSGDGRGKLAAHPCQPGPAARLLGAFRARLQAARRPSARRYRCRPAPPLRAESRFREAHLVVSHHTAAPRSQLGLDVRGCPLFMLLGQSPRSGRRSA